MTRPRRFIIMSEDNADFIAVPKDLRERFVEAVRPDLSESLERAYERDEPGRDHGQHG